MKMIVGLGNPEEKFFKNRHNVGWMFLDTIIHDWQKGSSYLYAEKEIDNEKIIFVKPTTFMNSSGIAVKEASEKYQIIAPFIYVVRDDLDLPFGFLRTKKSKQYGGHNGIKSIMNELNNNRFVQIKFGIGRPDNISVYDYVLSDFTQDEQDKLPVIFQQASELLNHLNDYDKMVSFNGMKI